MTADEDDGNGGWGHGPDSFPQKNILKLFHPGKNNEGRPFSHEKCTGNRVSYTITHVNLLLESPENPELIKERIVQLIPYLSIQQKEAIAKGISDQALLAIEHLNPQIASEIAAQKTADSYPQRGI